MKLLGLSVICILVFGCKTPMVKPDLTSSWTESRYSQERYHLDSHMVKITNTATEGEYNREGSTNFSYNNIPLLIDEPTKKTIEDDINKYLLKSIIIDKESAISIFVTIKEAKSYESVKMNGTVFIPIVGIFSGSDKKIAIALSVKFEIEKDKQVIKKWEFSDKFEKETNASTTREQDYAEIIRLYRQKFFEQVDSEILGYLNNLKITESKKPA